MSSARDPFSSPSYWLAVSICRAILRLLNRLSVGRAAPLPGPSVIVVSNHASHFDPPILTSTFPRPLRFLAKSSLFRGAFGSLLLSWGQVPIRRVSGGASAVLKAKRLLEAGWDIGLFIEGTRSPDGVFRASACRTGAATIAHLAKAKVLPVAIHGSHHAFPTGARVPRPLRISVSMGKPLDTSAFFSERLTQDSARAFTAKIASAISSLLPPEQREGEAPD